MYVLLKYTTKIVYPINIFLSRFNYFSLTKHSICKLDLGASMSESSKFGAVKCTSGQIQRIPIRLADSNNVSDYVNPHIMKFKISINVQYMLKLCNDGMFNQVS
jgi:hypothetical protein